MVAGYLLGILCGFGLTGIWIALAADEIIRGIVVAIRWKRGTWRGKSVVQKIDAKAAPTETEC